jgi:predicted lipoprotein with Yx(FWY)xxD motif
MRTYSKVACAVIALAGLAGVTACAEQYLQTASGSQPPVAVSVALARTGSPSAPPSVAQTEAPAGQPPIPEPTVAKTQKWVKIYSGASAKDLRPPTSIRAGSHHVELNVTANTQIGDYVSDGAGRTLYRFDEDSARPPKSVCNGGCAKTWPPLLIKSPGKIFPTGIDPRILGYVERADGHCQVTIGGHPVYYFSGDAAPGDFRGQGRQGKWFAVTATGGRTHFLLDPPPAGVGPGN